MFWTFSGKILLMVFIYASKIKCFFIHREYYLTIQSWLLLIGGSFNSHCAFQALPPAAPSYAATAGAAAAADREPGNKNSWCWKIPFEEKFGVLKNVESWQIIVVEKIQVLTNSVFWKIAGVGKFGLLNHSSCWKIKAVEKLFLLKNSGCLKLWLLKNSWFWKIWGVEKFRLLKNSCC